MAGIPGGSQRGQDTRGVAAAQPIPHIRERHTPGNAAAHRARTHHEPDPTIPGGRVARARTTKRQLTYLAVALLGTLSGILLGWILVQLLLVK